MTRVLLMLMVASATACAGSAGVGTVRFANEPIVWQVNDRKDIAKPKELQYYRELYFFDALFFRRLTRAMEMKPKRRAKDVNALGEVPDSTWFVNRMGLRSLTPADVAKGPNQYPSPDMSKPWRVTGMKSGGTSVGLTIKDGRGIRYLIKFDEPGHPVVETAAHVVAQRLLWAAGYHVPEDSIVYIKPSQLVLDAKAKLKQPGKGKRAMTPRDLRDALAKVHRQKDGRYRVLASRFLSGAPLGGLTPEGTRPDDANDTIPHEDRRSLRGLYLVFAWLGQVDVKEDNTLDMWVTDADKRTHYVMHYLVDFGKALGSMNLINKRIDSGHTFNVDFAFLLKSIPPLGLWARPWERARFPKLPGIGRFEAKQFNPGFWKGVAPYPAFSDRDIYDGFWAAKIIAAFTPAHIRAAVAQGRYEDARTARYAADTLIGRQRKLMRYYFARTNPIDRFRVRGDRVCFRDLLIAHKLATAAERASTRYHLAAYDFAGRAIAPAATSTADTSGSACMAGLKPATTRNGYTIVRVSTRRGSRQLAPVEIHLARRDGRLRIIGVNRR